jgi:hypothetical protein
MCWEAVIECQVKAGAAQPKLVLSNDYKHVIDLSSDTLVTTAEAMRQVPQGASVGFFMDNDPNLKHLMIATGAGSAAGTKNLCIGIGQPVGWEILNLAQDLTWENGGFKDPGGRLWKVCFRPLD